MWGIKLRPLIGLIALGAIGLSWVDIIPGDELIVSVVLSPLVYWGLIQNTDIT